MAESQETQYGWATEEEADGAAESVLFWKDTCKVLNQVMPTLISPPFEPTHIFDHLWLGTIWTAKQLPVENQCIGMVLNWTDATTYRAVSYLPTVSDQSRTQLVSAPSGTPGIAVLTFWDSIGWSSALKLRLVWDRDRFDQV